MQQDNKPNNDSMNSMGRKATTQVPRARDKTNVHQNEEFIDEDSNTAVASTAERGSQPKVPGPEQKHQP